MAGDTEFRSTACEKYETLLEDYLSGELSGADAKSAVEHWQNCAGCRTALQQAAASLRLLRGAGPSADPGPGFVRAVMARIRAVENESIAGPASFWQPLVSFGWRFAATVTLALAVLVTYNAGWGRRMEPKVATARPTDSIDIFAPEPASAPVNRDEVLMMVADNGYGNN